MRVLKTQLSPGGVPRLCHEGVENTAVTRRRSYRAHFVKQLAQERNMMMMRMPMRMTMKMTMMMTVMMVITTI